MNPSREKKNYIQESIRYNKEIRKQTIRWGIIYPLKKILWQEERIEKRRQHKIALKVQHQEEQKAKEEEEEKQRQRQRREEELLQEAAEQQQDNTTIGSSSNKRKSKWSSVWSSSSSTSGLGGGGGKKKISSKLPSRRNYEYTEFTEIVIKHFILNADQINQQLVTWQELDPRGTKHHCEEVRKLLQRLNDLVDEREKRSTTSSKRCTARAASCLHEKPQVKEEKEKDDSTASSSGPATAPPSSVDGTAATKDIEGQAE